MSAAPEPAWLVAWRERKANPLAAQVPPQPAPRPTPAPRPPKPHVVNARTVAAACGEAQGFREPRQWLYDGGVRREAVVDHDHNPPRVVRRIGWHRCLRCLRPFFSQDVIKHRLCYGCRADDDRYVI